MYRPLKSKNELNTFNIGEILDNPSVFGKQALSKRTAWQPPLTRPVKDKSAASTSKPQPQTSLKRTNEGDRPAKRIAPLIRLDDEEREVPSVQEIKLKKQEGAKKVDMEDYAQKSSIVRFNQSSYDVMEIIKKKRELRGSLPNASSTASPSSALNKKPPIGKSVTTTNKPAANSSTCPQASVQSKKPQTEDKSKPPPAKSDPNKLNSYRDEEVNESRRDFLLSILDWKTSWFKNPSASDPPALCGEKVQHLKLDYSSVDEYIRFYKPLMLNEIWSQICERVEVLKKSKPCKVKLFIHAYEAEDDFLVLTCVLPITADDYSQNSYPIEGDLMVTEIGIEKTSLNSSDSSRLVLGYVSEFVVDEITEKTQLNKNIACPSNCKKLLRYIIKLKSMSVKIDFTRNVRCSSIYYLKPKLKQCEALTNLHRSALHPGIVNPEKQLLSIRIDHKLRDDGKFNASQLNVIYNANNLVNGSQPGILLVQGPPGAGKTHTLTGMVKRIFLDWKGKDSSPKVLICAPSNGAIDEIAKRLYKEKSFLLARTNRELRIVRVGQEESLDSFVKKNMYLDALIEKNIRLKENEANNFRDEELEEKEAELNQLTIQANSLERAKEFDELNRLKSRMNVLKRQIGYLEKNHQQKAFSKKKIVSNTEALRKKLRMDILTKADIILSTLTSCCSSSLLQVFNEKRIFNCCIIDEASQANEPELLMPLSFNSITKLILIGDPMQLPATTISTIANKFGFGRSLFERFYNYLRARPSLNQFYIMLNIQYRMHSEICAFPSRQFYNNLLGSDSRTDRRHFPLLPYKVFDIKDTAECKRNVKNIHNQLESDFVVRLTEKCSQVLADHDKFRNSIVRIGIITPYQGQRRLLEDAIGKHGNQKVQIEVNTIDGFQGREMDIIIISAVRSFKDSQGGSVGFLNSYQRLNVAITRAKCSLFICLNADSLQKNSLWRELIEDAKRRSLYVPCNASLESQYLGNFIVNYAYS